MVPFLSIVVLTFNRPAEIERNIQGLLSIDCVNFEIIVVNNGDPDHLNGLPDDSGKLKIIHLDNNIGVGARNVGIRSSQGDYIITIDDDVFGLDNSAVNTIVDIFRKNLNLCALNFKVIDDVTERQVNWIHHRKIDEFCDKQFETYEISEGAVAFRRSMILKTDLYPNSYFISHEGPDLALQVMKLGFEILYSPRIIVRHSHAEGGRLSWRRYYYDTRNQIWLAARHYPVHMAARKLSVGLCAMLVYAIRDGFIKYYFSGIKDALLGMRLPLAQRVVLSGDAYKRYLSIESENPSFWYMVKKRIAKRRVRI